MKVAYNACFGGFSLSPIALTEYAKKKGISLTWYNEVRPAKKKEISLVCHQDGYEHLGDKKYVRCGSIPDGSYSMSLISLTKDLGEELAKLPNDYYYYETFYGEELRSDPDLIDVIEELGTELASGNCAVLAIEEIPDGAGFEIDEYDGNESVVPPRQSW